MKLKYYTYINKISLISKTLKEIHKFKKTHEKVHVLICETPDDTAGDNKIEAEKPEEEVDRRKGRLD